MTGKNLLMIIAPIVMLAGCGDQGAANNNSVTANGANARAAVARSDPRLPAGVSLFVGAGGAREFQIAPAGVGQIATFSVDEGASAVRDFYEREGVAAGSQVIGRVTATDLASVDLRDPRPAARPHTVSVMAVDKGPLTNVTIMIDVTP